MSTQEAFTTPREVLIMGWEFEALYKLAQLEFSIFNVRDSNGSLATSLIYSFDDGAWIDIKSPKGGAYLLKRLDLPRHLIDDGPYMDKICAFIDEWSPGTVNGHPPFDPTYISEIIRK